MISHVPSGIFDSVLASSIMSTLGRSSISKFVQPGKIFEPQPT